MISGIFISGNRQKLLTQYLFPYFFFTTLSLLFIGVPRIALGGANRIDAINEICKQFVQKYGIDYVYMGNLWFLVILGLGVCLIDALKIYVPKYRYGNFCLLTSLILLSIVLVKIPYQIPFLLKTLPMACFWIFVGNLYGRDVVKTIATISSVKFIFLLILFVFFVVLNGCVNIGVPAYNDTFLYVFNALLGVSLILWCSNHKMPHFIEFIGRHSLFFFASEQLGRILVLYLINYIFHTNYESMVTMPVWLAFVVLVPVILFCYTFYYMLNSLYSKIFDFVKRNYISK